MHIGIYWWVVIGSLGLIWLAKRYPSHRAAVLAYPGNLFGSLRTAMGGGGNPFTRNWKTIALILGTIVILAGFSIIAWSPLTWGPQWRTPRLADIGAWSWHNWLPLCIVWGLLAALFAKSKAQQKLLTVVIFMLFIGIPGVVWISDATGMSVFPRAHCSFSPNEVRRCALTEDWSYPTTASVWTTQNEYQFCVVTSDIGRLQSRKVGANSWEMRSSSDTLTIETKMLKTIDLPSGKCPVRF